jgi:hypothetical protein
MEGTISTSRVPLLSHRDAELHNHRYRKRMPTDHSFVHYAADQEV